ncbi:MAG: rhomboid family intramembrane serine protease [Chloroflexi bacterium]|nr:rhomboid family intramembrane serine protease [Chloroflexota bacterium]
MFPIGDDNHGARGLPVITWSLIALNVLVFLYQSMLPLEGLRDFIFMYGSIPAEIEQGQDLYTLLTSMFVHGGFAHIFGNMLFLWIFGDNIEQRFGPGLYLAFYLGSGLAATGAHILTNSGSTVPSVGASGAISGVMGAYVLLYPTNRVWVWFGYFGITHVPAFFFLGFWFVLQFINGLAALSVQTAQSSGVAFWAHIGGFVAGLAIGGVLALFRPEPERVRRKSGSWRDDEGWLW